MPQQRSAVRHGCVGVDSVATPGKFITVEGIEGSGKSTLLSGLVDFLRDRGVDVVATREPGGTALGNLLRAAFVAEDVAIDPIAEAFVVNASRAQHVVEIIGPALKSGRYVLCDRFAAATFAYQGYGHGVALSTLETLVAIATRGLLPDLTLLLDVDVAVSRERVAGRARAHGIVADRIEREGAAFHERVRAGYLALAARDDRMVTLDGLRAPRELLETACGIVTTKLGI